MREPPATFVRRHDEHDRADRPVDSDGEPGAVWHRRGHGAPHQCGQLTARRVGGAERGEVGHGGRTAGGSVPEPGASDDPGPPAHYRYVRHGNETDPPTFRYAGQVGDDV
ncbi:hypothetical protein ACTWLT_19525 [Micromonospora sp. ZYX-F-536]|uniref:hypothetical protein n=1 Tax=Micromonospora sp. ZYX-F-536 TaxID=3457629 RepID=UPI004040BEAE